MLPPVLPRLKIAVAYWCALMANREGQKVNADAEAAGETSALPSWPNLQVTASLMKGERRLE
jgi:hypothetical protein